MDPLHYDGSAQMSVFPESDFAADDSFEITDEMRMNISGNPFLLETEE